MKRSNRLVLLIGVFLAIVAFVGIIVLNSGPREDPNQAPTELNTVVAKVDIPLGAKIQSSQLEVKLLAVTARNAGALEDPSQAVGKIARVAVAAGGQVTTEVFNPSSEGTVLDVEVPAGKRAMSVQVDQVSGVGTVIKTGDYVDMVVGFTGDKFPVITLNPADESFTVVSGINSTSVKVLIQGLQVLGTLLPPAPADQTGGETTEGGEDGGEEGGGGTTLTGQSQIVILAVDAQQSELLKFAQLDGSVSLALRSQDDFIDPATGLPIENVAPDVTSGLILKTLVDTYGVLPPELVETVLPEQE